MIITNKPWRLSDAEFNTVMTSYVSCRDVSRLASICRRCGYEIPAGGKRAAFCLRTSDGRKLKSGYCHRACLEVA
jgi:hypothetical protein